jgi:MFS superfamily sulfate permease-like transporter
VARPRAIGDRADTRHDGRGAARLAVVRRAAQLPDEPNRDLFAFGVANVAAGASGSFAVGSSTSRTAAMDQAGSRTQLPSLVLAVGTLLLLLFGTALLADIPSPAIGAIVGVAILPLLGIRDFAALWRADRFEFLIGAVCFLVTLFIGSIPGILVAFVLALVNLARRAANPAIDVLAVTGEPTESLLEEAPAGSVTAPGVIVVRLAAPLFFANGSVFADAVKRSVTAAPAASVQHVVIDMEAVTDVDVTGAEAFESLVTWLDARGITLGFSRVRPDARARLVDLGLLGDHAVYDTNRAAIGALEN